MSRRITRRPQARRDVIQAAPYITEGNLDTAMRFADAVRATGELLAETPGIGAPKELRPAGAFRLTHAQRQRFSQIFDLLHTEG